MSLGACSPTPPDRPRPVLRADVALAVQRLGAKFAAPRDEIIAQLEAALDAMTGVDLIRQAQLTAALARELQHSVAEDRLRPVRSANRHWPSAANRTTTRPSSPAFSPVTTPCGDPAPVPSEPRSATRSPTVGSRLGDTDRLAEGLILEANGLLESGSAAFRPVLDRWFGLLEARDEPRDRYMVATRRAALALLDGDADRAESLMHDAARVGEQIHEPDTGNVLMSQRVALARARNDPDELRRLPWTRSTGGPALRSSPTRWPLALRRRRAISTRPPARSPW